jgi:hypothetical protein
MKENKGKRGPKFTKAQREQVIQEGMNKILFEHYTWKEFTTWMREEYGIVDSNRYWGYCWENIKSHFADEKEDMMQKILHLLFDLNKRGRNDNDRKIELETIKELSKIMGLHQQQILSVQSDGNGKVDIRLDLNE